MAFCEPCFGVALVDAFPRPGGLAFLTRTGSYLPARPARCRRVRELRRVPAPQETTAHSGQNGQPNGLPSISRKPHGYRHRTVQKTQLPVLAATSRVGKATRQTAAMHPSPWPNGSLWATEASPPRTRAVNGAVGELRTRAARPSPNTRHGILQPGAYSGLTGLREAPSCLPSAQRVARRGFSHAPG